VLVCSSGRDWVGVFEFPSREERPFSTLLFLSSLIPGHSAATHQRWAVAPAVEPLEWGEDVLRAKTHFLKTAL